MNSRLTYGKKAIVYLTLPAGVLVALVGELADILVRLRQATHLGSIMAKSYINGFPFAKESTAIYCQRGGIISGTDLHREFPEADH